MLSEKSHSCILAFSSCADPKRISQFNDFYNLTHLPDVLETPGTVQATRYVATAPKDGYGKYLNIYEFAPEEPSPVWAAMKKVIAVKRDLGRTIDFSKAEHVVAYRRLYRFANPQEKRKPVGLYLLFHNYNDWPREEAINKWYHDVHLKHVCEVPGVVAGSRWAFVEGKEQRAKYCSLVELGTLDPAEAIGNIRQRLPEWQKLDEKDKMLPLLKAEAQIIYKRIWPMM